jgi:hypothetical protein
MNNYTSIFRIGILDDLHNYFPDLLYNSDRFQSVQDVLQYIQRGARINPFEQGLREYNRNSRDSRTNHVVQPTQIPIVDTRAAHDISDVPVTPQRAPLMTSTIPVTPQRVPLTTSTIPEPQIPQRQVRRRPVTYYWADSLIPNRYENNLIDTSILTNLFTMALNPSFTDVPVIPTNQQVDAATTLTTSQVAEPCAICQDAMDPSQSVRRINRCQHAFHRTCIDTWFESGVTCPICRIDIRD